MIGASNQAIGAFYPVARGRPASSRPYPALPMGAAATKRAVDVIVATIALLFLLLMMPLIALWIRLDSPGPVLFRQRRVGFAGREFEILKFRTMRSGCEAPAGLCQATRGDDRVTRAGTWLRRWSIDELPQMINVLRGEMSLVGPRPHAPGTCAAGRPFEQVIAAYPARHRVLPGITGLAQIRGWRGETETEEKLVYRVQADLEYINHWSLWLDLKILACTPWALATTRNAY